MPRHACKRDFEMTKTIITYDLFRFYFKIFFIFRNDSSNGSKVSSYLMYTEGHPGSNNGEQIKT